jgi:RNA polymerase sigma-70 factor, ECF subfamily
MDITDEILDLKPYLFGIAYNMRGEIHEAEDVVQDIYEKWLKCDGVASAKSYLSRMTVNRCIDRLKELKIQRESYKGYWLPEPFISYDTEQVPTLEYGLMVLLERLNPVERAVFIMRESFSEDYQAIAELTGATMDNCRQILHRAHLKLGSTGKETIEHGKHAQLTEVFLVALQNKDLRTIEKILRKDIELYNDGGGKRAAALKPLLGFDKVIKFLTGIINLTENQDNDFEFKPGVVNGHPAGLIFRISTGELDTMQYVVADENAITKLLAVRNPDKLRVR